MAFSRSRALCTVESVASRAPVCCSSATDRRGAPDDLLMISKRHLCAGYSHHLYLDKVTRRTFRAPLGLKLMGWCTTDLLCQ